MSGLIYHIHYRPGFKIGLPDGLSSHIGEGKSGVDVYFFEEEQLIDLKNDDVEKEEYAEDVELEEIDVVTWEKKNGL